MVKETYSLSDKTAAIDAYDYLIKYYEDELNKLTIKNELTSEEVEYKNNILSKLELSRKIKIDLIKELESDLALSYYVKMKGLKISKEK